MSEFLKPRSLYWLRRILTECQRYAQGFVFVAANLLFTYTTVPLMDHGGVGAAVHAAIERSANWKTHDPFFVLDERDDETDSSRPMPHLTFFALHAHKPRYRQLAHETAIGELVNT